ncbi:MAG: hypothetical protein ACF8MF_12150 [Phycisphaerales bacterium JB052]
MIAIYVILGVLGAAALIMLIIKAAAEAEKRRKQRIAEMQAFAQSLGLSFHPGHDPDHDERYDHFEIFQRGFDRAAYNTIFGTITLDNAEIELNAGDYTYKTRERYTTTDSKGRTRTRTRIVKHHFSYFIMELPYIRMPNLLIRREGIFDKIASAFGKNDIDFESAEFSRKYYVKCESRKFAYDIVHPRMMEFLLETKPGLVDIEQGRICLSDGTAVWKAPRFSQSFDWTKQFLDLWPDFVVKDLTQGRVL